MKIKMSPNRELSFRFFVYTLGNLKKWPWTRVGVLKDVDEGLLGFKLPREDVLFDLKRPVRVKGEEELRRIHDKLWKENEEKIKILVKSLRRARKYLRYAIEVIPSMTREEWSFDEINYYPVIYKGGSYVRNNVFVGVNYPKKWLASLELVLNIAIHETIHVNVDRITRKIGEKVRDASREIVVIHYTSRIFKELNEEFNLSLKEQRYHLMFSGLEKYRERIEKMIGDKGYEEAVLEVDGFVRNLPKT
ncbi:MAG: hypothetical protein J7L59_02845 [Nanoarchaeota archaeon]|nr:hypothetical protein [Nanoarchaeota archaeon]